MLMIEMVETIVCTHVSFGSVLVKLFSLLFVQSVNPACMVECWSLGHGARNQHFLIIRYTSIDRT